MVAICKGIAESAWFQNFILATILLAGLIVGVQTYELSSVRVQGLSSTLQVFDNVILWIFVAEAAIKIVAEGKKPWRRLTRWRGTRRS